MIVKRDDVITWVKAVAAIIEENSAYLTQLDSEIGDADHGANMNRGFNTVIKKLPDVNDKDIGTILKTVGMTLISTVGGAGGPLYGTWFLQSGIKTADKFTLTLTDWTDALEASLNGIKMRGKAEVGDKTMVDALTPAVEALKKCVQENINLSEALNISADAAKQGMEGTIPLVARKGRASYLGERSAGHQDPGATSTYLILKTAAETWNGS